MQKKLPHKLNQKGFVHRITPLAVVFVLCFGITMTFRTVTSHAAEVSSDIKSGIAGYCLDDHVNNASNNAAVDSWRCNGSNAQKWSVGIGTIKHGSQCLGVENNGITVGNKVVLASCSQDVGQVWLRDQKGLENPNSGLCLSVPNSQTNQQLTIDSCSYVSQPFEIWTTPPSPNCSSVTGGERVACFAEQEWSTWQSANADHESILNNYTDGSPYEEWCADFVSYVYRESGNPFKGGESIGWDENIASNVFYRGFTVHSPAHYNPKPGDVAFFDYGGGHVEIVVSGGSSPTFVYGNSATIDPATGNGQMKANTIVSKGVEGQLLYYLSRN